MYHRDARQPLHTASFCLILHRQPWERRGPVSSNFVRKQFRSVYPIRCAKNGAISLWTEHPRPTLSRGTNWPNYLNLLNKSLCADLCWSVRVIGVHSGIPVEAYPCHPKKVAIQCRSGTVMVPATRLSMARLLWPLIAATSMTSSVPSSKNLLHASCLKSWKCKSRISSFCTMYRHVDFTPFCEYAKTRPAGLTPSLDSASLALKLSGTSRFVPFFVSGRWTTPFLRLTCSHFKLRISPCRIAVSNASTMMEYHSVFE